MVKIEDGAQCIFTSQSPPPLFLVKRDGGVGYDSTDLAAVRWRTHQLGLDWVIYVVDAGQSQHFEQIF
jgi:arginyl-tRNA synthetase